MTRDRAAEKRQKTTYTCLSLDEFDRLVKADAGPDGKHLYAPHGGSRLILPERAP